jgi:hypothetical protein
MPTARQAAGDASHALLHGSELTVRIVQKAGKKKKLLCNSMASLWLAFQRAFSVATQIFFPPLL